MKRRSVIRFVLAVWICLVFQYVLAYGGSASSLPHYRLLDLSELYRSNPRDLIVYSLNNLNAFVVWIDHAENPDELVLCRDANQNLVLEANEIERLYADSIFLYPTVGLNDLNQLVFGYETLRVAPYQGTVKLRVNNQIDTLSENDLYDIYDISNELAVVGAVLRPLGHSRALQQAFYWKNGQLVMIPFLGGIVYDIYEQPESCALAVNDTGLVIGWSSTDPDESIPLPGDPGFDPFASLVGPPHAFMWQDLNQNLRHDAGELVDIGSLFGSDSASWASSVNNQGEIVGCSTLGYETQAFYVLDADRNFYVDETERTELTRFQPDYRHCANDINNQGIACGQSWNSFESRAVLWIDQQVFDLNSLVRQPSGSQLEEALAINDRGWVLCRAQNRYAIAVPIANIAPFQSNVSQWDGYR